MLYPSIAPFAVIQSPEDSRTIQDKHGSSYFSFCYDHQISPTHPLTGSRASRRPVFTPQVKMFSRAWAFAFLICFAEVTTMPLE